MASTNKTTNYGLNQWVGTDLVKREDFNSDNIIIDTKLKENANAITSHLADNVPHITSSERTTWNAKESPSNKGQPNGYAGLGSDGRLPFAQAPLISLDNGRYQSDFGFSNATLSSIDINGDSISIGYNDGTVATRPQDTQDTTSTGGTTSKSGILIHINSGYAPNGLKCKISLKTVRATKLYVLSASKTVLATLDITGAQPGDVFTILYNFVTNTNYYIAIDANSSNYICGYTPSVTFPFNSTEMNIIGGLFNGGDNTSVVPSIYSITPVYGALSGTAIKTVSPADVSKWGNIKWVQNVPTNASVVCDILKSDGTTVLKSNITSINDLSDIDIIVNPTIKIRFTLTRASASATSPTVLNASITWEGKNKILARGTFADNSTLVPSYSNYTKTIPLGFNATSGILVIATTSSAIGYTVYFDTIANNATCGANNRGVNGYVIPQFHGDAYLNLLDCYISDSNLIIVFQNTHSSGELLYINFAVWEVKA